MATAVSKRRNCRPFTLIELLVVIAIIGILASLLLPVLRSAKERGQAALCISNLHQMGMAMANYVDDHDSYLPYSGNSGAAVGYRYWAELFYTPNYERNLAIFVCPSWAPRVLVPSANIYTTYGIRVRYLGNYYSSTSPTLMALEKLGSLNNLMLLADSPYADGSGNHGLQCYYIYQDIRWPIHLRHLLAANMLFLDGHVDAGRTIAETGARGASDFAVSRYGF